MVVSIGVLMDPCSREVAHRQTQQGGDQGLSDGSIVGARCVMWMHRV